MNDFNEFLEHVMKSFTAAYPYGLNKTDVTKMAFQAWCQVEAQALRELKLAEVVA